MATSIKVLAHKDDGRAKKLEKTIRKLGKDVRVRIVDVYTSEHEGATGEAFRSSLVNPVTQNILFKRHPERSEALALNEVEGSHNGPTDLSTAALRASAQDDIQFDWALEIGFLPGVTDNIGHTASELLELSGADNDNSAVYASQLFLIKGNMTRQDIEDIASDISNALIQRASIKSAEEFQNDNGMDVIIPKVHLHNQGALADDVDLNISDEALQTIGNQGIANQDGTRRGPLGMSLLYMQAVRDYFKTEGRPAKDIELETIAQTWSEHCKHTIFASPIDEVKEGLYKHYIKRATQEIRKAKGENDICVSVFSDNAGAIIFDDNYLITDKVETHNSPSALDPFGGAITGIVGVNRDCIGFGMGAKPIINRYGFCLADPRESPEYYRDQKCTIPVLSPETIMKG
ncbi:MAG: phosphoribosylformylglycinamidine synthase, partial [Bdellovibrionales bacterium]